LVVFVVACGSVKEMAPDAGGNGLDAPTDVSAIANIDHGVRLSWTAPVGTVTTYTITGSPAGGTVQVVDTQALVTGLDVGTSYTFTVTATNDSGAGPASEPSTAVTVVAGPAAPTNLVACGADGQITVRADAPGATSFNVYFDANQGVTELSPNKTSSPSFPFVHTGRSNGQPLHYVVTAVDANGIESLERGCNDTRHRRPRLVVCELVSQRHVHRGGRLLQQIQDRHHATCARYRRSRGGHRVCGLQ